ncbi:Ricin-type beta-trefoil lectin domain-containing protein [Actinacidiphila cocklensis]|uniref:Ricin-type beta-trefoil lectin domain-containing protein n=1 Tax=Actinacidiphila cocklensis TaxID=887465 RepID=A0A9W4E925_9ACTN|nr:Ricin-type beta-trefoil lectin domain-containing protein [Actinacidiphila cocklensis]
MLHTWWRRFQRGVFSTALAVTVAAGVLAGTAPSSQAATQQPCDIYAAGGTPCVAAHSTVRALYGTYTGSLYQVRRSSDSTTRDIGVVTAGGRADAAAQDSFCANTSCVITTVYDQSGHGNDLRYQGPGGAGGSDTPANATSESLTVGGGKAYSLYINPGNSYWRDGHLTGIPTGSAPEGAYMVTSGTHVNHGCCFDYGNSETDRKADGAGAMDAIYFGTSCWFGGCTGTGPWVQADLEYGLYSGGSQSWNSNQKAFTSKYVTAMLKNNGTSRFAIKGADAQSGGLSTLWDGALPPGYSPMKKQGAIILGSGGDCCNGNTNQSQGTFYEGAIVAGYPSDTTDNAVQANIAANGYGSTTSPGNTVTVTNPGTQNATAGTTVSALQIQAADSGSGQTLTFTASGLPTGLSISSSGRITGTPTTAGSYSVAVTATDSTGARDTTSFTWTVAGGGSTGGTCHVVYAKSSEWPGGFTGDVTIGNTGTTPVNGWTLTFSFPGDQKITNGWNATVTQSGTSVTATNVAYNATVSPAGTVSFGFQGTYTSDDTSPTAFTLNGSTCT